MLGRGRRNEDRGMTLVGSLDVTGTVKENFGALLTGRSGTLPPIWRSQSRMLNFQWKIAPEEVLCPGPSQSAASAQRPSACI